MTVERKETLRVYRYYDWVMALFVTVLIVSNIASSAKIVDWGFSCGYSLRLRCPDRSVPVSYLFVTNRPKYRFQTLRRVIWQGLQFRYAIIHLAVRILPVRQPGRGPGQRLMTHISAG